LAGERSSLPFRILILEVKGNLSGTRAVVAEHGDAFPILLDSDSYARKSLRVTNTPTLFVIDGTGRIRARLLGAVDSMRTVIEEIIERFQSG
jgi:hypothetical protein